MKRLLHTVLQSFNTDRRDWVIFSLSLLLAYSIWLIHNLSLNYSDFLRVKMSVVCNIEGHSPNSVNSCEVVARCRTSGYNFIKASLPFYDRRTVTVPLEESALHHKGGDIYYITKKELNESSHLLYGEKVSVEYFLSDTLFFRFPYENFKKVPVHPVQMVSCAPQYMLRGTLSVDPDSVIVYGEPYHLANIDRVFTETIKLANLRSGTAGVARIENIKGVRLSSEEVHYSIDVSRFVELTREVSITGKNVPKDREMMIYPSRATLVLKCVFPLMSDVDNMEFAIDCNDFLSSRSGKCVPEPENLPEGVIDYEISPEVFECVLNLK